MRLDQKLNFVVPIYRTVTRKDADGVEHEVDEAVAYVHSTPILRETFDRYCMTLAKTFASIYSDGLGFVAGPRVAMNILQEKATDLNDWDGDDGVKNGLLGEINRLTSYIAPGKDGWEAVPLEVALQRKALSDDDVAEVTNAVAFFIVNSAMLRRMDLKTALDGAAKLWGARVTFSGCTEFIASLPKSTVAESTGATAAGASQMPY